MQDQKKEYERPAIRTLSADQILAKLGPANAVYGKP
jgi:hypothetical protein